MTRLWVDTDVGTNVDDAVALLVAVAHPALDLVGISIVGDDAERRAETAASLVPAGTSLTLGADPDAVTAAAPDVLLAIGPLTNVAALVAAGADIRRLVVMGGTLTPVHHRGRLRHVEHNFASDPAGAAVVLAVPGATLVTLDQTVSTRLDGSAQEALVAAAPALAPLIEEWLAHQRDRVAVHLHDPAALLVAAGEPMARLEPRRLAVEADGRLVQAVDGAKHIVAVALDGGAVARRVLQLLAP